MKLFLLAGVAVCAVSCNSALRATSPSLDFGDVLVGDTSKTLTAAWHSDRSDKKSEAAVKRIEVILASSPFQVVAPIPYVSDAILTRPRALVSYYQTPIVSFVFTPTAVGSFHDDAVAQAVSGPIGAERIELSGRGILRFVPSGGYVRPGPGPTGHAPNSIDFGDIVLGTSSYRTLTLTNPNDHPRTVVILIGGLPLFNQLFAPHPFRALRSATAPLEGLQDETLGPKESVTIVLEFAPLAIGPANDTLELEDSVTRAIHAAIDLTGRAHASTGQ